MKFEPEKIATARASGLDGMVRAHWREVAVDKEAIPLDVDWEGCAAMEAAGTFVAMTARTDAGELVGYNAFFVAPHKHYRTTKFALNDVLYMRPAFRGLDGIRLILHAEKWLSAMGVQKVIYHSKDDVVFGGASDEKDSLDSLEQLMDLEAEFDREFPDGALRSGSLGHLLEALGYSSIETTFGRLL